MKLIRCFFLILIIAVLASPALANQLDNIKQQLLDSQKQAAEYKQELIDIRAAINGAIGNKKTVKASYLKDIISPFKKSTNPDCRLSGKVIRVADGDSITVLDKSREQHKIRFSGIDAPETGQPYGKAAKRQRSFFLKSFIKNKSVFSGTRKINTVGWLGWSSLTTKTLICKWFKLVTHGILRNINQSKRHQTGSFILMHITKPNQML